MRVDNLTCGYGDGAPVLREVSFALEAGTSLAVVGPNGSGKSTLLRLLAGLLSPQKGTVFVGDCPMASLRPSRRTRHVSILFQNPDDQIFASRVSDELRFALSLAGLAPDVIEKRMAHAASLCGIKGDLESNPHDLSRARRKRVCLASVLMMETPLVLLDEPLSGQDAAGRQMVMQVMDALGARGSSVVAVTHDMNLAASFDSMLVLGSGHVRALGDPRSLFSDPSLDLPLPDALALGRRLGLQRPCFTENDIFDALRPSVASGRF
ncbi:energy-coupling factor ABC transporter ATP-binding protein [Desulfoluna spongiiphila]|uniref:Energy-coupling factor transport system ATP-binding protein/energy-coupling factor transport system ATP-binding protein n=1 Tax=Desulfoluna spongiiphila TaxID=419481 RepID=A0A1G5C6Q5_9BACT|nr:ABC transporter ATP-binding protein [Desulfoluna spongiiphila]SCX98135.1 energy-coupling factor transport system ATP-binding protein/energy-coupling factor transport system ATP-binding protein [Desulfoluna spongiiphila]